MSRVEELLKPEEINEIIQKNPSKSPYLWDYWSEFVNHYLRRGRSEQTISNVRDILRFVILNLGIYSVAEVNDYKIFREILFKVKEERNWSNTTFNSYIKNIKTFYIWLEEEEYIVENKIGKIGKCRELQNEQYVFQDEQVKRILSQIVSRRQSRLQRWRNDFFVRLLILIGARPCELLQLQVIDVQKTNDTYKIIIRGRKQKGRLRYYTFPSEIRDSYEMYMRIRSDLRQDETTLFISSSKRTGWTDKGMRCFFKKLSKELEFNVNAYAFRRYVATKMYKEGVPIEKIRDYLGHTRISTTLRYIERSCCLTDAGVDVMRKSL